MTLFRREVFEFREKRLLGEVVLSQPVTTRVMVAALFAVIVVAGVWLSVGSYSRIETVPGILVTDRPATKILATSPGMVSELAVREGQLVKKGDRLVVIKLDRHAASGGEVADRSLIAIQGRSQIARSQIDLAHLRAASERDRLNSVIKSAVEQELGLSDQILLQQRIVDSNQKIYDQMTRVVEAGYISKVEFERRHQNLIISQQSLANLRQQRLMRAAERRQAEALLNGLSAESARGTAEIHSNLLLMEQQQAQLEGERGYVISAPISGRITAIQTAQGRTANPTRPLMTIVPDSSRLRAELYAPTRAIGFVDPGQEARILYDAFPYTRFGSFAGKVETISKTVIDPRETDIPVPLEEPVYRITVILDHQSIAAYGKTVDLQPGMALKANIVLERQTFLQWLLQPLNSVLKRTS